MDINGVSSSFLNTITDTASAEAKADEARFQEILEKAQASSEAEDEELMEACEEFEAYYLNRIFAQMRQTINKSGLIQESQGRSTYEDWLYNEYSEEIAKSDSGIGLKNFLYNQLRKD